MRIRERVRTLALASLLAGSIVAIQAPPASAVACSASGAAQYGITVKPSHGKAFYVDYALTPKLDANYVGYSVTSTSSKKNLWVKLSNFTGGYITLANASDDKMQIAELAANASKTTYFLLKSSIGSSTTDQVHKVEVFQGDPSVAGNTAIYSCDYTFTDIKDVIAANPNKVNSVSINNSTPNLGDLVTVTVTGDTGTIGSGSDSPDLDVIWLSPSPYSNFQTRALRLESVTLNNTSSGRPNSCPTSYEDTLLITSARTCFDDSSSSYSVLYRFRVIGSSSTTVKITPNANISSGNPIKHTSLDPTKVISLNLSGVTAANFKIKKEVVSNTGLTVTSSKVEVPYRLTITTTSATNVVLDLIVDSSTATASAFTSGSATFTDVNRTGSPGTAIVPETRTGSNKLFFVGPFTLNSTTPLVINYKMSLPVNGSTYRNEASAFIGDVEVSNTAAGEYRSVDVVVPSSCSGTCNVTQSAVVAYSAPTATTRSAINVLTTTATIRGSFTTGGDPNTSVKFFWGTDSALASSTTVDLGIFDTSGETETALAGLSAGTTYYYRINASNSISGAGGVSGDILSFVTGAPTATTNSPDQITITSARLKGSFTTGGGQSTAVTIRWGTDSSLVSGTNISIGTFTSDSDTSTVVTGLTPNMDYFYRIIAVAGALTANGEIVPFSTLGPAATTVAASGISQTGATLNGTIGTGGGATTTPSFQYSTSPTLASGVTSTDLPTISSDGSVNLAITGLTAGTTYYFRVLATLSGVTETGTILSFVTSSAPSPTPTPSPTPVPVQPIAPTLNSVSASPICSLGRQIFVRGANFTSGKFTFDGKAISPASNDGSVAVFNLPSGTAGTKKLVVTTDAGTASLDVVYQGSGLPKFAPTYMPYLHQGGTFAIFYSATDADSYRVVGQLPSGFELNTKTGSISGISATNGVFQFSLVASGICGETELKVTFDIDKAVPNAISHRIYFSRNNGAIPAAALDALRRFLDKVQEMSPRYINPQIFITTSTLNNTSTIQDRDLEMARYQAICDIFVNESLDAQVVPNVFTGDENIIEVIAYWPKR